jgi:hypothetical protein
MKRGRGRLLLWSLALVAGGVLGAVGPVGAEEAVETTPRIYKWVDANGIAHYTTDPETIPRNLRDRFLPLRDALERAGEPVPAEQAAPSPEPAAAAPAGESDRWAVRDVAPAPEPPEALPATTIRSEPISDAPSLARATPEPDAAEREELMRARADLDQRIAELEAAIAQDEEALRALISREPDAQGPGLVSDPALREIAGRLPGLQEDLRALQDERNRLDARE